MIFKGIPYENWNDYYYRSLEEIDNKNKAIYKWIKNYTELNFRSLGSYSKKQLLEV